MVPAKGPQTPALFPELPLTLPPPSGKEPGLFDLIIVNDSLDKAYWALKEALSEVGWGGGGASGICVANGYSRLGQVIWWPRALGEIFLSSASLSLWQEIKKAQATGQEATVRTGHGTTDWFQIGRGVRQG